jgi:hypothetical protein
MTSTYHTLRTSKTAHLLGVAVGAWAGRVGSPAVIRTSDGAAIRMSVFATDANLDALVARGAG